MRIIAAGPYHNFVFWVSVFGLGWIGVGRWLAMVGYMDVTVLGKGVVAFDKACPYGIAFYEQNVIALLIGFTAEGAHTAWCGYH
jgi:hypothetical protein